MAETKKEATSTYVVAGGTIVDSTGKKRKLGEAAELTKSVAEAYLKSGAVITEKEAEAMAAAEAEETTEED